MGSRFIPFCAGKEKKDTVFGKTAKSWIEKVCKYLKANKMHIKNRPLSENGFSSVSFPKSKSAVSF